VSLHFRKSINDRWDSINALTRDTAVPAYFEEDMNLLNKSKRTMSALENTADMTVVFSSDED
jgi:hypothetical protein